MFPWNRVCWYLAPDDLGGGGGAAAPPAAPASAGAPSPAGTGGGSASAGATTAPPATATAPANPAAAALAAARQAGVQTGAPTPGTGQALGTPPANVPGTGDNTFLSIRDAVRQYGYDLGQVPDDHSALQQLILRARAADQQSELARIGQQFVPHMAAFQQWQQQQRAAQQQQTAAAAAWHKPPEYDPSWANLITRDPTTGEYKPVPGAPPDIVQRLSEARRFQAQFSERFAQDPIGTIKPGLEGMVREVAQQMIQEQIGQYRDTSFGEGFISQNSSWLHSRDQQGNVAVDAMGNPVLSQAGNYFRQQLQAAVQLGIRDERARANYAMGQVRAAYAQEQLRQLQAGAAGDAAKAALLQQQQQFQPGATQTPPNVSGVTSNSQTPVGHHSQPNKLDLASRIRGKLQQAGVTDQTIRASVLRR